jgi:hypothetical protein
MFLNGSLIAISFQYVKLTRSGIVFGDLKVHAAELLAGVVDVDLHQLLKFFHIGRIKINSHRDR